MVTYTTNKWEERKILRSKYNIHSLVLGVDFDPTSTARARATIHIAIAGIIVIDAISIAIDTVC
jgi:hypothetical protein